MRSCRQRRHHGFTTARRSTCCQSALSSLVSRVSTLRSSSLSRAARVCRVGFRVPGPVNCTLVTLRYMYNPRRKPSTISLIGLHHHTQSRTPYTRRTESYIVRFLTCALRCAAAPFKKPYPLRFLILILATVCPRVVLFLCPVRHRNPSRALASHDCLRPTSHRCERSATRGQFPLREPTGTSHASLS